MVREAGLASRCQFDDVHLSVGPAVTLPHERRCDNSGDHNATEINNVAVQLDKTKGRSGVAVACLTTVREVLGSNRALGSCVYLTTTVIYSLGHGLCAPFLQCLGQLSLLP